MPFNTRLRADVCQPGANRGPGQVIVRDTGPGIPAEDLPHIFERFYRAEKSRTRGKSTGFGLGLSIVNWIVERHGGRIEVSSQEGKATAFAVWLPLFSNSQPPAGLPA
jgi:signal transduction histidine kinase